MRDHILTAEMEPKEVKKKPATSMCLPSFPFMCVFQLHILQKEEKSQIVQQQEAD